MTPTIVFVEGGVVLEHVGQVSRSRVTHRRGFLCWDRHVLERLPGDLTDGGSDAVERHHVAGDGHRLTDVLGGIRENHGGSPTNVCHLVRRDAGAGWGVVVQGIGTIPLRPQNMSACLDLVRLTSGTSCEEMRATAGELLYKA